MSLKNRSQFSSTLDNDLKDKLKELSDKTKIPTSKLLDEAVELLLEKRGKILEVPTPTLHKSVGRITEDDISTYKSNK